METDTRPIIYSLEEFADVLRTGNDAPVTIEEAEGIIARDGLDFDRAARTVSLTITQLGDYLICGTRTQWTKQEVAAFLNRCLAAEVE